MAEEAARRFVEVYQPHEMPKAWFEQLVTVYIREAQKTAGATR